MASQTLPILSGDKDRSLQEVLNRLQSSRAPLGVEAEPIITAVHRMPAVAATYGPYPAGTDSRLISALAERGVEQLYAHQSEAFAHVLARRNVVTITPTASGKTLCYNAPVLNSILQDPSTRALYLFPTKALAQDQLSELHGLAQLVQKESACGPGEPPEDSAEGTGEPERVGGAPRATTKDRRVHLRRRHTVGRTARDSRQGPCRAQ